MIAGLGLGLDYSWSRSRKTAGLALKNCSGLDLSLGLEASGLDYNTSCNHYHVNAQN